MIVTPVRQTIADTAPANATVSSTSASSSRSHKWGLTNIRLDVTFLLLLLFRTAAWLWLHPMFNLLDALTFSVIHRVLSAQPEQKQQRAKTIALEADALANPAPDDQPEPQLQIVLNDRNGDAQKADGEKSERKRDEALAEQSEPLSAPKQVTGSNAMELSPCQKSASGDQPKELAAATASASADVGQKSALAFGLLRSGGSIGFLLTAGAIALCTKVFTSDAFSVLELFLVLVGVYDVCCALTIATFPFFRTRRVAASVTLFADLCTELEAKLLRVRTSFTFGVTLL